VNANIFSITHSFISFTDTCYCLVFYSF